jgi:multisubunit Na+/H+ antiporter MnhE subunit
MPRRALAWSAGWALAAALYLVLVDTTDLPELIVGAAIAILAATGLELAREQHIVGQVLRSGWLARAYRPIVRAPADVAAVSLVALRQLARPRPVRGQFRAVPFRRGEDETLDAGRQALAEALGSFAPNTIVVGIDSERELILAHQLRRGGGPEAVDPLGLG